MQIMIYPFVKVPVPSLSGYALTRKGVRYVYAYVGERQRNAEGKSVHPKSKMIGRIARDEQGKEMLVPNQTYYKLMNLEPPVVAVAEGPGRKPAVRGSELKEKKEFSEISSGFGYAIKSLSLELGVGRCLEEVFTHEVAQQLEVLAAYICDGPHSSLAGLNDFVNSHLCFDVSSTFDRRRAGEMLVKLSSEDRGAFFSAWNQLHEGESKHIFYDVTSFSTYSNQIRRASYGYNRDEEDLPQLNEGLFCSRQTGLPLYMCAYEGSLNDAQNFNYVLIEAKQHHLSPSKRSTVIVIDGGFSTANFNWAHMEGYSLIAGVSALRYKDVRRAYVAWSKELTVTELSSGWKVNNEIYLSKRIPFAMGGVDGELVMYRDLNSQQDSIQSMMFAKEKKLRELESCSHWKGNDFDSWAKSFEPYYKVTKARNKQGFTYIEDTQAQQERFSLCGKVTLFTTCKKMSDKEIMEAYRAKESIEDCFDTSKNGLSDKRLHVHGDRQVDGKMFALFIALIFWRTLHQRAKQWQETYNATVGDVIDELNKIRYVKYRNVWALKYALTKKQKELLEALALKGLRDEKEPVPAVHPKKARKNK